MSKKGMLAASILMIFALYGCKTAPEHYQQLSPVKEKDLTVGVVQKEIKVGMSQAEVAAALGAPNILTRDSSGQETWVYDKIATVTLYSQSSGGVGGALGGGLVGSNPAALLLGLVTGGYSEGAGAVSTSQKTFTVLIKFDRESKVSSFSYHATKF